MKESFRWYKSAADDGHGFSQVMVGAMLAAGQGAPQDLDAAKSYLTQASQNGQKQADELLSLIEK
mgnify:CR=1 FL=1